MVLVVLVLVGWLSWVGLRVVGTDLWRRVGLGRRIALCRRIRWRIPLRWRIRHCSLRIYIRTRKTAMWRAVYAQIAPVGIQ